jgi:hypothetical protein
MLNRGYCIVFTSINVFSETTTFIIPLKEIKVFYHRNAVCGRMLLVGSLVSDLMSEFVFLKKKKKNQAEEDIPEVN